MKLAKYFIDQRGQQPHYFDEEARARGQDPTSFHFKTYEYNQSHIPVREQDKVVGHAVRAMYLYSGMADIATEYGDDTLTTALDKLWNDLNSKNLYITGGLGPSDKNEGFTTDYDLPNETAYAETCAAVGLVFWANRMLGLGPDGRYADVMEHALYNGTISGLSLDGSLFFYENPLESRGTHNRWKWHRCPCCPPNIGRMVASIGSYMYGQADGEIAVHLYCDSTARLDIGGETVTLTQQTRYPWDGAIAIAVDVDKPSHFTIHLRIPEWSSKTSLSVNGQKLDVSSVVRDGYARIEREWKAGDKIELDVALDVRRVYAHPEVRQDAGRVAIEQGPLLYCLEGIDNSVALNRIAIPGSAQLSAAFEPDLLGGIVTLNGTVEVDSAVDWGGNLYRNEPPKKAQVAVKAVPYFAWDNREPGEMLVWLRGE
jgi:DUF1680 family protein